MEERAEGRGADRVHIVENDHGIIAAQLHRRALERLTGVCAESEHATRFPSVPCLRLF
jgi:hypothetical protein